MQNTIQDNTNLLLLYENKLTSLLIQTLSHSPWQSILRKCPRQILLYTDLLCTNKALNSNSHGFRNILSINHISQMHFRMLSISSIQTIQEHTASASRIIASRCLTVTGNDPVFSDSRRKSTNKLDTISLST